MISNFILPKYDGGSLLNIPATILKIFGLNPSQKTLPATDFAQLVGKEKIVLFLADGLGFNFYQKFGRKLPFFRNLETQGKLTKITSVFPASTPPALATLYTGLPPLQHGLPEWYIYLEELGMIVHSLPIEPARTKDFGRKISPPADILLDSPTIFQTLQTQGMPSYALMPAAYENSNFNNASLKGSQFVGFNRITDLLTSLNSLLTKTLGKALFLVYWPYIDASAHIFGPWSKEAQAEAALIAYMLQTELVEKLSPQVAAQVGLILTADHGLASTDPLKVIYLDGIPGLEQTFQLEGQGYSMLPVGSARNLYLYIKKEKVDDVISMLRKKLAGKAEVLLTQEVVARGWFGTGKPHPKFLKRIGNVAVLPYDNQAVWFRYDGKDNLLKGHHGGLSADEMYIPFFAAAMDKLQSKT